MNPTDQTLPEDVEVPGTVAEEDGEEFALTRPQGVCYEECESCSA